MVGKLKVMLLALVSLLLAFAADRPPPTRAFTAMAEDLAAVTCGTERWPVKTLSDPDAGKVQFQPVATSVEELRSLPKPAIVMLNPSTRLRID